MPSSMPAAPTLLSAAIKYLEEELMPELGGYHRFKCRITVNVLNTIRRELEHSERFDEFESSRLSSLLGHGGSVEKLSEELAAKIRSGQISGDEASVRKHIRESLREALTINNPRWIR